jgi:hypothetical protein
MYYLAKVPDAAAASTTPTGLSWFKVEPPAYSTFHSDKYFP